MAVTIAQATEILNQSLSDLGYGNYNIPTPTGSNDAEVLAAYNAVGALPPTAISDVMSQVVAILVFRNYGIMFDSSKNPIRKFLRNDINFGGGEEDIYHEILSPIEGIWAADVYKGTKTAAQVAEQLVDFYQGDVQKKFHTEKINIDLAQSLSEYEVKQVFTPEGFARFVEVKMANLQWSAEIQLLNQGIAAVKAMVDDGKIVFRKGHNPNTINGVTTLVEDLRTVTDGMQTPVTAFNYEGVLSKSDENDLFLFVTPEFVNRLQTRGYANAFNVEYYRNNNRLVEIPYGTALGTDDDGDPVHAILLDRRALVLSIMYWAVKPFIVSNTDYTNYFLKIKLLKGYNEFFNAVAFSGEALGAFSNAQTVNVEGGAVYNA